MLKMFRILQKSSDFVEIFTFSIPVNFSGSKNLDIIM